MNDTTNTIYFNFIQQYIGIDSKLIDISLEKREREKEKRTSPPLTDFKSIIFIVKVDFINLYVNLCVSLFNIPLLTQSIGIFINLCCIPLTDILKILLQICHYARACHSFTK